MFNPSRDEARRFLAGAWRKYRAGQPLTGLEQTAAGIIAMHPEYHALLEDLAFAWRMNARGFNLGMVDATRRMEVAMYDSAKAMRSGWTRIFIESCGRALWRLNYAAFELFVMSVVLPGAALLALALGTIGSLRGDDHAVTLAALGGGALVAIFTAVGVIHQRQRAARAGSGQQRHELTADVAEPDHARVKGRRVREPCEGRRRHRGRRSDPAA
jgi:hypothetical protein